MQVQRVCRISPYAALKDHTENCPSKCEIIHRTLTEMDKDVKSVWKRYEAWRERRTMRELQRGLIVRRVEK